MIIGVKSVPCGVESYPTRAADAAHRGQDFALRSDAQPPASVFHLTGEGTGQAEGGPQIAFAVELGTESVFMIVTAESPSVSNGFEQVRPPVLVLVHKARDFRSLGDVERVSLPSQSKAFMHAARVFGDSGRRDVRPEAVLDEINLPPAGGGKDAAVRRKSEGPGLQDKVVRVGEWLDRIVVGFFRISRQYGAGGKDEWSKKEAHNKESGGGGVNRIRGSKDKRGQW